MMTSDAPDTVHVDTSPSDHIQSGAVPATPTASSTLPYSWSGFTQYAWKVRWEFLLSLVFLLLAFGQKLFSNTFSIDTEAIIQAQKDLYRSWIQLSRFGFVWLKKIAGTYWYNNALSGFLTVILFATTVFLWGYVFYALSEKKEKWHIAFFAIPLFVSPIMAEQLGFLLQSPSVCVGMMLVALAVMTYVNAASVRVHRESHRIRVTLAYHLLAILLLAAAFSLYTAQISLFISAVGMVYVYKFFSSSSSTRKSEHSFTSFILIPAVLSICGYIIYSLLNRLALYVYHTSTDAYVNDQVRWGKDSLYHIIVTILRHARTVYFSQRIYYSLAFTVLGILLLLILGIRFLRRCTPFSAVLIMAAVFASPLIMSVLLGMVPTVRTEFVYPYVFSFIFLLLHELLSANSFLSSKWSQLLAWLVLLAVCFGQGQISNRIFYTESVIYQQDVLLASQLATRIGEVTGMEHPSEPVVYIGRHIPRGNADTYKSTDLDLIGRSIMDITFSTTHGDWVKNHFMAAQGYSFRMPSRAQESMAEQESLSMPRWPAEGSVQKINGVIIVKF
ncbi:hypothetical protein B9G54_03905 [Alloscardovia macacae]|uniref:Glucosyl transferase GtrII n=1 Tax=Alloscardovia macacae TaxID=1160091 RepID=A0A1Y2SZL1_9BIFI|nr:glucosyltransferase domain-containing protein [Alloscardovia macacae]OTA26730.1 hypothetical protein B9G54_03905 [Alloscardovia macacae]OTA29596.1 hypothetical protein B9T39_03055 [Alloscardovia macacae]